MEILILNDGTEITGHCFEDGKNLFVYLRSDSRRSAEFAKNDSVGAPSPSGENAATAALSLDFIAAMTASAFAPWRGTAHSRQSASTSSFGFHES